MPTGSVTPAGSFNGGTITLPQTIDVGSRSSAGGLEITGTSGANVKRLGVDFLHTALNLTGDGTFTLSSDDGLGVNFLGTGGGYSIVDVASDAANSCGVNIDSRDGVSVNQLGSGVAELSVSDSLGVNTFKVGTTTGWGLWTTPPAPATTTFVSGTGKQLVTTRDVHLYVPVTFNPTGAAAATCAVAISKDDLTYYALWTETEPIGVTFDGTIHGLNVYVPAAWYVKLTATNATIGTGTYY